MAPVSPVSPHSDTWDLGQCHLATTSLSLGIALPSAEMYSSQCSDSAPAPLPALCEMSPLRQQTAAQSGVITQHNNNYLVVSPATFEYSRLGPARAVSRL